MNTITLEVKLFNNFILRNPIWVASSHLTADESSLGLWSPYKPAALTLKTSSLVEGGEGTGGRTYVRLSQRASWFTDGPKKVELISGLRTKELLAFAKETLPETFVGVSILQDEDYGEFKQFAKGADFVELNTKYTGRLPESAERLSYLDFHDHQHQELIKHLTNFSNTFSDVPQFVKLSRDFPWLTPCKELELFSQKLIELTSAGRKIGLIIANTPRLRVPPSALSSKGDEVPKRMVKPIELSDGVLCGEDLFLGTYNLIREIRLSGILPVTIPIIASGGILRLEDIVDILQAGADAIQMCTAFQEKKYQYYAWLNGQLDRLLQLTKCASMPRFCLKIREEGETGKQLIREAVNTISVDFKVFVNREIKRKDVEILEILSGVLKDEARQANIQPRSLSIDWNELKNFIHKPSNLKLPSLNYTQLLGIPPELALGEREQPRVFLSMMGSLLGHAMLLLLSEKIWPGSNVLPRDDSASVLKTMSEERWDLAVISMANLVQLKEIRLSQDYKPVLLGVIAAGRYVLRSATYDLDNIKEIYHFGGLQSEECLGKLIEKYPTLRNCAVDQGTITDLAQLLQMPVESIGIFVKDPIGQIYPQIMTNGNMKEHASIPVYYCLLSSKSSAKTLGRQGLTYIYQQLSSWRNEIEIDASNVVSLLKKDNILEKFIKYLEPA